ncbi:MAG: MBL fold metallo-hydrolase [Chloroflexi bacterium]|nr:MBL fold metallo-hydrolase [Chloroflexota bacterium]MDA1004806.1 MBL fold metallo-hydrolase [Chloroflexota bacterium]
MAELVVPGVWWLHETRGSNVYLVDQGAEGLALIDTGFASSAAGILGEIASVAPGRALTHVLLTHAHFDHSGAAAELRERTGALVVTGAGDCELDEAGAHVLREAVGPTHRRRSLRRRLGRVARSAPSIRVDVALATEQHVAGLLAIPMPGHTPGSTCYLFEECELAFVGDLVISHRDILSRPMRLANDDDALYLDSLKVFAQRAPAAGCPGHGKPWREGFGEELRTLSGYTRRGLLSLTGLWGRARRMRSFASNISRVRRAGPARLPGSNHRKDGGPGTP